MPLASRENFLPQSVAPFPVPDSGPIQSLVVWFHLEEEGVDRLSLSWREETKPGCRSGQ